MNALELFIQKHVNMARGGYQPEEVVNLIRQAWANGRVDKAYEQVIGRLDDLIESRYRERSRERSQGLNQRG